MWDDAKQLNAIAGGLALVACVLLLWVALGLALAFRANAQHEAAAVAMAAALLHVLNHSWFKSLLFLGAGAILHATGRRDLDGLGGLIHRMPRTAAFFLVGALAISALPPLNGFVSEWLLFQSVLAGPMLPQASLRFAVPAIGAMLALAAALAAACFVRVYGIAFLGRPRSDEAAHAHDAPLAQQIAMGGLAGLCILGGLFGSVLAQATLREAKLCAKEGITINIFLISTWNQTEEDIRFARRLVESTQGRVIFSTGRDLDRYVVWDYIKRRKSIIA